MEDEDKEGYQELIEDLSKLKQNKNELELEILSIKKEKNLEMSSLIDFDEKAYQKRLKESKEYTLKDEQADRTFVFPARLEQAMISNYGNYEVYLLFESGAYSYRAQKSVDIVDRVIVWG